MASNEDVSSAVIRQVEPWTAFVAATGILAGGLRWGWRTAVGVAAGALLGWLNYRWMKHGVISLSSALPDEERTKKRRIPKGTYVKFIGRFVLLLAVVCVILWRFEWLAAGFLGGFFAPVAGLLAAMIAQLFRSMYV